MIPAALLTLVLAAEPSMPTSAPPPVDALALFNAARSALEQAAPLPETATAEERAARARDLVRAGLLDAGEALLSPATDAVTGDVDGLAVRFELAVARNRCADAVRLGPELERRAATSAAAAWAHVERLLLQEDLAALDAWWKQRPTGDPLAILARGELLRRLNRNALAHSLIREALQAGAPRRLALLAAGRITLRLDRVEEARWLLGQCLEADPLHAAALNEWALALARLGQTTTAADVYERLVACFPSDAAAHYALGNGSARHNYTELEAGSPAAFPRDAAFVAERDAALRHAAEGRLRAALAALETLASSRPAACEPPAALASLLWVEGRLDDALRWSRASLEREPAYGRAHAVLAKVLDARRQAVNVHRERDEKDFAATPMPKVPGIDRFVLDWSSLSDRHAKRVALSIQPLAAFLPALLDGGQTYYIKPLHERLSETPSNASLKDQRVGYDARLWDDVRGVGGNNTVTGIEDVEGAVVRRYDTVLHELVHQVHGVLTEEWQAEIERCYTSARQRETQGKEAFINRYQASSSWEYFAEGVHAACVEPRDEWDTREIRRDRLEALDPDLLALARRLMAIKDSTPFRAPALTSRAWKSVEDGNLVQARTLVDRALSLAPEDETTLATSAWLHLFANDPPAARELAARARVARPKSAAVALVAASAERHATGDLRAARAILDATRPVVDPGHLHELEGALAWLLVDEGRPAEAAPLFRTILNRRADEPDALQGLMNALAFLPGANEAELRTVTSTLVKKRAGSRGVRAEAAIALARLGDVDAARPQVAEGLLNAPDSDEVWAAAAYVEWRAGDRAAAAEKAGKAMSLATTDAGCFNDLAAIVAALCHGDEAALARLRARAARPPEHVYVAREHSYRSVHRFGPLERELLGLHATGAGSPGAPAP